MVWRNVSAVEKASNWGEAKSGKVNPNAATKRKKIPLKMQNGFQNLLLLQPHFIIIMPRKMGKSLCHVSGR